MKLVEYFVPNHCQRRLRFLSERFRLHWSIKLMFLSYTMNRAYFMNSYRLTDVITLFWGNSRWYSLTIATAFPLQNHKWNACHRIHESKRLAAWYDIIQSSNVLLVFNTSQWSMYSYAISMKHQPLSFCIFVITSIKHLWAYVSITFLSCFHL